MQDHHHQHQREEVSEKLKKKARICQVLDILMMMSPINLMTRSQLIYQQNENDIISFVNQNLSRMVKIWMMLIMVLVLKKILIMMTNLIQKMMIVVLVRMMSRLNNLLLPILMILILNQMMNIPIRILNLMIRGYYYGFLNIRQDFVFRMLL